VPPSAATSEKSPPAALWDQQEAEDKRCSFMTERTKDYHGEEETFNFADT